MKKTLLVTCLAAASFTTFAQDKATTFGIKGGVNFASVTASANNSSASITTGTLTSFHAGIFADLKLSDNFSIQPALLFTNLGGRETGVVEGVKVVAKTTLNYFQLPINAVYYAPVGSGKLFFGAGPFIGYAVAGQDKATGTLGEESQTMSQDVEFGEGAYKRTNFGIGGLFGYKLGSGLLFNVSYDLGLSSIVDSNEASLKTKVLGLSVGYAF